MKKNEISIDSVLADLMTAMMFIFIISLVAYMLNFNDKYSNENKLQSQMKDVNYLTSDIVKQVSKRLDRAGVEHSYDVKKGIISFSSEAISFSSGKSTVDEDQKERLLLIRDLLKTVVPCYVNEKSTETGFMAFSVCKNYMVGRLESIVIEGHTDNMPVKSSRFDNIDLSYERAKEVYNVIVDDELKGLKNNDGHNLFTVLGAGATHPINYHKTPTNDLENRRIEIRFIMDKPWA